MSVDNGLIRELDNMRYHIKRCFAKYIENGRRIIKLHHLMEEMEQVINDNSDRNQVLEGNLGFILSSTQEAVIDPPYVSLSVRPNPGVWEFVRVSSEDLSVEGITSTDYLKFKAHGGPIILSQIENEFGPVEWEIGAPGKA